MKNKKRYGIREFDEAFGTEAKCVKVIFEALHSYECSCGGKYQPLKGRRQYQCSKCRHQIAPTTGTIFHKSDTPLVSWFFAIYQFSNSKSGYSALKLQRDISVTYKTAWRMLKLIREALPEDNDLLSGIVEADETKFGGHQAAGEHNANMSKAMANKSTILGAVERGGRVRVKVSPDSKARSIWRFLNENVAQGTTLMTDKHRSYRQARKQGYVAFAVDHSKKQFVLGRNYTNTIDAFWSHVKRSVTGTHKVISKKHLQSYLDGFAWHYNQRKDSDRDRFSSLLGVLLRPAK